MAGGSAIYLRIKKNILACSTSKDRFKAGSVSLGLRCRCVWVEWGFGDFLKLHDRLFGEILPHRSSLFHNPITLEILSSFPHNPSPHRVLADTKIRVLRALLYLILLCAWSKLEKHSQSELIYAVSFFGHIDLTLPRIILASLSNVDT